MAKENHTPYVLLGMMTTGCNTGYSMKQMIDNSLSHFWKISYGQIYPSLKKLTDEGLAISKKEPQTDKPDKIIYEITDKGRQALEAWLVSPVDSGLPVQKNEWLLKLFFSRHEPAQTAIAKIKQYETQLQERLSVYQQIEQMIKRSSIRSEDEQFWLFTLRHGFKTTNAAIEWCREVTEELQNEEE
ncbi:PadR family transcriptional regulator [Jeotgalibacillus sp. R-1-5s-1]|uniref:PadR family transcriptional regulator n=1 Tax=Jeotgalibacillus sp. R-1-5s-1 TaxID=2555897 RepID=UPI00106A1F34|nr:PadR family transcriptional regulator [Jeotgalibacillus sp. R-1-5s-1]TFE00821.1 PadR family transcriptional regulator [Jeotgalibacillus sp. R-1-5s-1]